MSDKFKMSQMRFDELTAELEFMQTVREKEVAEQIKEARSFGDLSENSEYDEAKTEQGKLYSKIAEVKKVLENAEIIERSGRAGMVSLGSKVTVCDVASGDEDIYEIVGSQEASPVQMRISDESPMGRALIDKKKGATVTVQAPNGDFKLKILAVEN